MAFSLGIISYTFSRLVSKIEEVADNFLEDDGPIGKDTIVPDDVAEEIFDQITEKSTKADIPKTKEVLSKDAAPVDPASEKAPPVVTKSTPPPLPEYEDVKVTEYYLRYNWDLGDIANTRIRSDFAGNAASIFRRSTAHNRIRRMESARETQRLRAEAVRSDEIRRAEIAEKRKRSAAAGKY